MNNAYAALGILFILIFAGAWYAFSRSSSSLSNNAETSAVSTMKLTSTAFAEGTSVPSLYTCDGKNINPPLSISEIPAGTKSLALIMDDPDVPKALKPDGVFDHWVLFNISATTTAIAEGSFAGIQGNNGAGKLGYTGPCPPTQYEPSEHRYNFVVYALNSELVLKEGVGKLEVLNAIKGHVLEQAQLMGRYKRIAQ
jgi:hypothetical protein